MLFEKLKDNNNRIIVSICTLFTFFYYGIGFMTSYQPDIYIGVEKPYIQQKAMLYGDGRWLNALIFGLLRHENQPYGVFYGISFVISIILMIGALSLYAILILRRTECIGGELAESWKRPFASAVLSCVTLANMFSVEFFLYPDTTVGFILSILLCVCGAWVFNDYLVSQKKRRLFEAFLCVFFCVFMSEAIASSFVMLTCPLILFDSERFGSFVKNQLCAGVIYGFSMFSKVIMTINIVHSERASFDKDSIITLAEKNAVLGKTPEAYILSRITFGMWIFLGAIIILTVIMSVRAIGTGQGFEIIKGLYITFVVLFAGFFPFIVKVAGDYKPRVYYPVGTIFGLLAFYGWIKGLIYVDSFKKEGILTTAVAILLIAQFLSHVQMFTDQYITNYEDKYISEMIGDIIDDYEKENDIEIKKVVFYCDAIRTKYARSEGWCLTQRAYDAWWSKLDTLNFYLGKQFVKGEIDDSLTKHFEKEDWDTFSPQQIVFIGDTAHICTY